jgi:hypothetical protein
MPHAAAGWMRPGSGRHITLVGLKQALVAGDSFARTLEFERAGKTDVKVVVQVPKAALATPASVSTATSAEAVLSLCWRTRQVAPKPPIANACCWPGV